LPLKAAYALTDREGRSVRQELERLGLATEEPLTRQAVKAALEVHIEQGPVLEQRSKTIGVVTGVQHMSRHEVIVLGQEAHAGPTPMDMRRDPIRVLSEVLPLAYSAARAAGADARLTVGIIETFPGSPNTVPGKLRWTFDIPIDASMGCSAPRSRRWFAAPWRITGSRARSAAYGRRRA
jgi:N-carbamoyl-L-amino-acid hydrolase